MWTFQYLRDLRSPLVGTSELQGVVGLVSGVLVVDEGLWVRNVPALEAIVDAERATHGVSLD